MKLFRNLVLLIIILLISYTTVLWVRKTGISEMRVFKNSYYTMKIPSDWIQVDYHLDERLVFFQDEARQISMQIRTSNIFPDLSSSETVEDYIVKKIESHPVEFKECVIDDNVGYTTVIDENNMDYVFYVIGKQEIIFELKFQCQSRDFNKRKGQIEEIINSFSLNDIESFSNAVEEWSTYKTDNLVIFYPDDSIITESVEEWTNLRKEAFDYITDYFNMDWEYDPIKIYVFDSAEHGKKYGLTLGFARPDHNMIFTKYMQSPGHELAHCISYMINDGQNINSALIKEGLATHLDMTGKYYHILSSEILREKNFRVKLLGEDFRKNRNSYTLGASFVQYLIDEYSLELFIKFYSQNEYNEEDSFQQFYEKEGSMLVDEWLEYLRKLSNIQVKYNLKK